MNNLIRAGLLIAAAFIGGTAGIAHHTAMHNSGSLSHISVLADGSGQSGQDTSPDGFSWG